MLIPRHEQELVARPVGLHFLPEDRATVDRALVTGRTLLETNPESPLVAAIDRLADAVVPWPAQAQGRARGVLRLRTTGTTHPR
jgi:MinD-like ATPase involved in chromosome partitioning or flagellar assembly